MERGQKGSDSSLALLGESFVTKIDRTLKIKNKLKLFSRLHAFSSSC